MQVVAPSFQLQLFLLPCILCPLALWHILAGKAVDCIPVLGSEEEGRCSGDSPKLRPSDKSEGGVFLCSAYSKCLKCENSYRACIAAAPGEALAWQKAQSISTKSKDLWSHLCYLPSPGGAAPGMGQLDPMVSFQDHVSKAAGIEPDEQQVTTWGK